MSDDIEHFLIYLFAIFGEVSDQIFSPFLSWPVWFPIVAFLKFFVYFIYKSFIRYLYFLNIFPVCLVFSFS